MTMARIRSVKPEFWTSPKVTECTPNARLLFIGLWNFCDDYGVHPACAARLKMEVFPGDSFTKADVRSMIDELIEQHLIVEYEVEGAEYWCVPSWERHQRPESRTGRFPRPDGSVGGRIRRRSAEDSPNGRRTAIQDSSNDSRPAVNRWPPELEQEQEREQEPDNKDRPAGLTVECDPEQVKKLDGPSPAFLQAWAEYPPREGGNSRADAWKAWKARLRAGVTEDELLEGVGRYRKYCEIKGTIGTQYVKTASVFLGPSEHWCEEWRVEETDKATAESYALFEGCE